MKRSTNLPSVNANSLLPVCLLTLFSVILNGCARLPYGPEIAGNELSKRIEDFSRFSDAAAECAQCFDGEILVNWTDPVNSISFSGYFQTRLPSSLRFSVLNPFGQPVYAVASDGTTFQYVNTTKRVFTAGSLRSYSVLNDIPLAFLAGPWGAWLSARPTASFILEVHEDKDNRGIWYSVADTESKEAAEELLLLDGSTSRMLERVILDNDGKPQAKLSYRNWQFIDRCEQPLDIMFTGLAYGAEAQLKLSDIQAADAAADAFTIEPPESYKRRLLP